MLSLFKYSGAKASTPSKATGSSQRSKSLCLPTASPLATSSSDVQQYTEDTSDLDLACETPPDTVTLQSSSYHNTVRVTLYTPSSEGKAALSPPSAALDQNPITVPPSPPLLHRIPRSPRAPFRLDSPPPPVVSSTSIARTSSGCSVLSTQSNPGTDAVGRFVNVAACSLPACLLKVCPHSLASCAGCLRTSIAFVSAKLRRY